MADDYIKRSDAINAYKTSRSKNNHRTTENSLVHTQEHNHILHILDKLPAADVVEVKHGKWVHSEFGTVCTRCGRAYDTLEIMRTTSQFQKEFKFCPNCGAKMDGKED